MNVHDIIIQNITFSYENSGYNLFEDLTAHFPSGWTGIVGANGSGKTTLLKLASGILKPNRGHIRISEKPVYCAQRTDEPPEMLGSLLDSIEGDACKIRGVLGIDEDWLARWNTLSHGERKRAQIGAALFIEPDCLAVDEPTNHLDAKARQFVINALKLFKGVGLLVSHDRELLDSLCSQCLFVDPPDFTMRPGGVAEGMNQQEQDYQDRFRQKGVALQKYNKILDASKQRQEIASTQKRRSSKRGLDRKDSDARAKIDMARVTGKDAVGGKLLNQISGRLKQARDEVESIRVKKRYRQGIWLESSFSKRDVLFTIKSKKISLGENRQLTIPSLAMQPQDRIGLRGPNGAGKSTLVRLLKAKLNLEPERVVYLPQEISESESIDILNRTYQLPNDKLGHLMTIISSLGSDPKRLLKTELLSPGEVRKLLLAYGITNDPHLIIMDEPTNHLDLPSIKCLEDALSGCTCGLLLVSHDDHFLKSLCDNFWDFELVQEGEYELKVKF